MSCIHISLTVTDKENRAEPRKQPSEDYYSGYYWGNEPYDSSEIVDRRKSDDELKNKVNENLRKNDKIDASHIDCNSRSEKPIKAFYQHLLDTFGIDIWKIPSLLSLLSKYVKTIYF